MAVHVIPRHRKKMSGSLLEKQNVLIIDDVTTSGSTLNEVLRTLRILNEDNEITIFSLIGRKDLMADSIKPFLVYLFCGIFRLLKKLLYLRYLNKNERREGEGSCPTRNLFPRSSSVPSPLLKSIMPRRLSGTYKKHLLVGIHQPLLAVVWNSEQLK